MSENLLPSSLENEPLAVQTIYPDPAYFSGWNEAQNEKQEEIDSAFQNVNPDIVGITHTDADGYGCEIMLRKAYPGSEIVVVTASESGPLTVDRIGDHIMSHVPDTADVYIMDLAPNDGSGRKFIDPFRHHNSSINVFDHHEWSDDDFEQIDWVANVTNDTERCATQIVHDELISDPDPETTEFADITADHDLWIKEDRKRSDALSDLSYIADREAYVSLALEHGYHMLNTKEGERLIAEARETRNRKTEIAMNRTDYYEINDNTVAIGYGGCNASDYGETLYEDGSDIVCLIYPTGKVSIRTPDDNPVARDIAVELGGGGHKCAAGGKIDTVGNGISYTTHWATMGRASKEQLVNIIENVV